MKKILFFISLLFAVVMYASPPPVPDIVAEDFQFVSPDEIQTVQTIEVQEVAFSYIGNTKIETCLSANNIIDSRFANCEFSNQVNVVVPEQVIVEDVSCLQLNELKKPPAFSCNAVSPRFKLNKQNSNYAYPFGADYVS